MPSVRENAAAPTDRRLSRGVFFCFEGIDGGGKTTQALRLKARLEAEGLPALYVKEPTTGPWGQKVRDIALHGRQGVTAEQELEYFLLDREEDVRDNILPALQARRVVIADRYFYSTIAYQSALGLDPGEIRRRNQAFPVPDRVFLMEVPTATSQVRITCHRGEQANVGYEQAEFLARVKEAFDAMDDPNIFRVDATKEKDAVTETVWRESWRVISGLLA